MSAFNVWHKYLDVRYVVDWTIQTGVSDVGLKNEQTLIMF
jgi:hypothetical protein